VPAEFTYDEIPAVGKVVADVDWVIAPLAIVFPVLFDGHGPHGESQEKQVPRCAGLGGSVVAGSPSPADERSLRDKIRAFLGLVSSLSPVFLITCPAFPVRAGPTSFRSFQAATLSLLVLDAT
jgi:hypothetical protein